MNLDVTPFFCTIDKFRLELFLSTLSLNIVESFGGWFIPTCVGNSYNGSRARKGEVLFIDARDLGYMKDCVLRDFDYDKDILRIANTFHAWKKGEGYEDEPGFCNSAMLNDIRKHGHVLTPGRYVGAAIQEDDGEPFNEKMERLTKELELQFEESAKLEEEIRKNLKGLGYGS